MYHDYPYGVLSPLLFSLIESEIEKANINVLEDKAERCDWEAAIKLAYYVPESRSYPFMIEKRHELVETVRRAKETNRKYKEYKKYLNKWGRAEIGKRPRAGGTVKIKIEPEILRKVFIKIMEELAEIRSLPSNGQSPRLFAITQEFWKEVGKKRISAHLEEIGPEAVALTKEEDIKEKVEKQFFQYILNDKEDIAEIAIKIMSEKYNVAESTIRKYLTEDFIRRVRQMARSPY